MFGLRFFASAAISSYLAVIAAVLLGAHPVTVARGMEPVAGDTAQDGGALYLPAIHDDTGSQQSPTPEPTTVSPASEKYEAYVADNLCSQEQPDDCLEETSYLATRSDGRQVKVTGVYRWRDVDSVQGLELPHFLLGYMRLLRNAYGADPEVVRRKANVWLLDNVGNLLGAENPELILGDRLCWRYDVVLGTPNLDRPGTGQVRRVGRITMDAMTGAVQNLGALTEQLLANAAIAER